MNIVETSSPDAAQNAVEAARGAGIPIIFFNREVQDDVVNSYDKCAFVGTDAPEAGHMQGALIGQYLLDNYDALDLNGDGTISYVMFKGQEGNAEAEARTQFAVEDADKLSGFASGGDDYVLKPFSIDELGARVAAHLRRETRRARAAVVRMDGGLAINYTDRTVTFEGKPLAFAKKEFDIIELLSQNPGQVFDKERIYERVWGLDGTGDASLVAERVRRIRAGLAAAGAKPYIQTVWGCGYKWVE